MADNVIPFPGSGAFGRLGGGFGGYDFNGARPQSKLLPQRKSRAAYVVRVDLDDARPPIWRRLRLASDMNLAHLHDILQVVMGWTNSHLHQFKMGPDTKDFRMTPFLTDYDVEEGETAGLHERDVRLDQVLAKPGQRLFYEYDFGDSWEHTIKLEKIEPWSENDPEATCVTGRRACPPEDVGGLPGYEEALATLRGESGSDPEWTRELLGWLPPDYDPDDFDSDEVNEALERGPLDLARWHPRIVRLLSMGGTQFSPIAALVSVATRERIDLSDDEVETATLRYRHLITVIGDGVKLTQAGYLPPALVQQLATDLSLVHADWPFPIVRESDTVAVLGLRESATTLGLVRKQHGRLQPTASGRRLTGDPRKLFNHIRTRMPAGRHDYEQDAGLLSLLYAAAGDDFYAQRDEAGAVFGTLGWGSTEPLGWAVWHLSEPTRQVHTNLTGGRTGANAARIAAALLAR